MERSTAQKELCPSVKRAARRTISETPSQNKLVARIKQAQMIKCCKNMGVTVIWKLLWVAVQKATEHTQFCHGKTASLQDFCSTWNIIYVRWTCPLPLYILSVHHNLCLHHPARRFYCQPPRGPSSSNTRDVLHQHLQTLPVVLRVHKRGFST